MNEVDFVVYETCPVIDTLETEPSLYGFAMETRQLLSKITRVLRERTEEIIASVETEDSKLRIAVDNVKHIAATE